MLRSNIVIASCRLFQSDGTYFMVPSNLELHVSSSQPRLGSRCFSAVQWALTFPNLRRHRLRYLLLRSYAKSFYVLQCFNCQHSISVNPAVLLPDAAQRVRVLLYGCSFSAVFQTGPLTLCVGCFCLYAFF